MRVDHLIVGQGLCGTLLSRLLLKAGHSVLVIDDNSGGAASRVAGGIVNPVTGKRLVRTWLIEELLPFAHGTYEKIAEELALDLVQETHILDFFPARESADLFARRAAQDPTYLHELNEDWSPVFRYNYGIGDICPALLVNLGALLAGWREFLRQKEMLLEAYFDVAQIEVSDDGIVYRDISASQVIFCDGATCENNPWFAALPWSKDKGESLILSIPGLPASAVYKQGVSIVPWLDGLFWVGASHDWKFTDPGPTPAFRESIEQQLNYWLKLPYTVEDHIVALRPANLDRRPFVGFHPTCKNVGILNGMGGKGISMAPWAAMHMAGYMTAGSPLPAEIDISRFRRMLTR